ncbi:MAG: DUF167 domain-containing protein [Candidatus Diapherotrites archaeon]
MKNKTFNVHVKPGKNQFKVLGWNAWNHALELCTKNKAEQNKANTEIERELSKLLKAKCEIIAGFTSRNKKIRISGNVAKANKILDSF